MKAAVATPNKEDLIVLHDLLATGQVTPVIEKRYRLNEVSAALPHCVRPEAWLI